MSTISMAVSVQLIEQEHYAQWLAYWLSYQEFYNVELSEEITLKTWARFFDEKEPIYCAVATDGKKIMGFVHYLFIVQLGLKVIFVTSKICLFHQKLVVVMWGKKLIDFVNQQAKQRNCARLYWHTQETNLRGQRLYDWVAEKPGVIEYRMAL